MKTSGPVYTLSTIYSDTDPLAFGPVVQLAERGDDLLPMPCAWRARSTLLSCLDIQKKKRQLT